MPQEDVELIDMSPKSGYYHVRTSEGEEGWVYSRNLELVQTVTVTGPTAVPMRRPRQPSAGGGVASSIPPNWDKPDPNETTFNGPDGICGPTGDGGDVVTNRRKNRTDVPAQYHEVTWIAVQALPYPVAGRSLADWTPDQLAQIQPFEGVPVSVVGYFLKSTLQVPRMKGAAGLGQVFKRRGRQ
jgi:hypothetical protein